MQLTILPTIDWGQSIASQVEEKDLGDFMTYVPNEHFSKEGFLCFLWVLKGFYNPQQVKDFTKITVFTIP